MDIQVDIFPKSQVQCQRIDSIFAAYLARTVFMFVLEIGDTVCLTTIIIITIQYALAECLAILGYAGFYIIIVGGILEMISVFHNFTSK